VGTSDLPPSAGIDRVDFLDGPKGVKVRVGDPFAVGRVGRVIVVVVRVVGGGLDPMPSAGVDRVDLTVVAVEVHIDDLLAVWRVGRIGARRDFGLTPPSGLTV
jgi:hypothetical protein